jgi:Astacin (Peptidase family M12A)
MNRKIETLLAGLCLAIPLPAGAGILTLARVHDSTIDYCFVGNAASSKPDDVAFIKDHLRVYENHGHIRYQLLGNGKCPSPTQSADGQFDVNAGDLRIGVPDTLDFDGQTAVTGLALGKGCGDPGTDLWWANFPGNLDVPVFRACRLNAFLRKNGMAENKILHEIGHSLGLDHEHQRTDLALLVADPMIKNCFQDVSYFGKDTAQGVGGVTLVTPYDRDSVMHYEINHTIDPTNVPASSACNLGNDNGSTGLSAFDQLAIRILYPHEARVAEFRGATVVKAGEPVTLRNEWGALGALTKNVLKKSSWRVRQGGTTIVQQATTDFSFTFQTAGDYTVEYSFTDMLDRVYSNVFTLRVRSPKSFAAEIAGPAAALSTLH